MDNLLQPIQPIFAAIDQAGGSALLVGGAVRDHLLGLPINTIKDIDIEVYGLTPDALYHAIAPLGRVDAVGRSFGVLKIRLPNGRAIDLSVPQRRSEPMGGQPGSMPIPDPNISPAQAAARRDFTWNAMALTATGELLDFYEGRADLAAGMIRHTSAAFDEDPLRVLRAMQFAARFDFALHPSTAERCRRLLPAAATLPIERIWVEWSKWATRGKRPSRGLQVLEQVGWIAHYPEIAALVGCPQDPEWHPEGDVFVHTQHVCDMAAQIADTAALDHEDRAVLLFAALCHDLGKPATTYQDQHGRIRSPGHAEVGVEPTKALLGRMGAPSSVITMVVPLVREHMSLIHDTPNPRSVRRLAVRLNPATITEWRRLVAADASGRPPLPPSDPGASVAMLAVQQGAEHGKPVALVLGRDLISRGYTAGPHLGPILRQAYSAQIDGEFETQAEALAWIEARFPTV
ncbi:MAG: multifunctional CCA addition/repair protein [Roseiflexaceae bacterium]